MPVIHRANLAGRPVCGAPTGNVSVSGVVVTCPKCQPQPMTRAETLAAIAKVAQAFRESRP